MAGLFPGRQGQAVVEQAPDEFGVQGGAPGAGGQQLVIIRRLPWVGMGQQVEHIETSIDRVAGKKKKHSTAFPWNSASRNCFASHGSRIRKNIGSV